MDSNPFSRIIEKSDVDGIMTRDVKHLDEDSYVMEAMQILSRSPFTSIVVASGRRPVGLVTEKDIIKKVYLKGKDPKKTRLKEIMTRELDIIHSGTSLLKAGNMMRQKRRLIVTDSKGEIVGILSQSDITNNLNQVYRDYRYLLWNPWLYLVIFLLLSAFFIINMLRW